MRIGNVCTVPPHGTAVLDYSNFASNSIPQILIAGTWPGGQSQPLSSSQTSAAE